MLNRVSMRSLSAFMIAAAVATGALFVLVPADDAVGQDAAAAVLQFDGDTLNRPVLGSWRTWPFLGTPLTPHDMNKGKAPFPEFHHVYIDPASHAHYSQTGKFREGTVIVKELVLVGGKKASSGRGYFEGDYSGLEIAHKSAKRYPKEPGNWAYYSFGHVPPPYSATAKAQATESCATCHESLADDDMVFAQYYPNLRAARPAGK